MGVLATHRTRFYSSKNHWTSYEICALQLLEYPRTVVWTNEIHSLERQREQNIPNLQTFSITNLVKWDFPRVGTEQQYSFRRIGSGNINLPNGSYLRYEYLFITVFTRKYLNRKAFPRGPQQRKIFYQFWGIHGVVLNS